MSLSLLPACLWMAPLHLSAWGPPGVPRAFLAHFYPHTRRVSRQSRRERADCHRCGTLSLLERARLRPSSSSAAAWSRCPRLRYHPDSPSPSAAVGGCLASSREPPQAGRLVRRTEGGHGEGQGLVQGEGLPLRPGRSELLRGESRSRLPHGALPQRLLGRFKDGAHGGEVGLCRGQQDSGPRRGPGGVPRSRG